MKDLVFRVGVGVTASLVAGVVYYLDAGLANALSVAVAVAFVAAAFVATPASLVTQTNSRQSFLVPILVATSMAFGALGAAISNRPFGVLVFVLLLLAMIVVLARSAAFAASPDRARD